MSPTASRASRSAKSAPTAETEASLRQRDLEAAIADVIEGLGLVDGALLGPEAQRQLGRARAAGRAAARLVAAGGPERLGLVSLLHDLEDRWGGHAAARGTALSLTIAPEAPREVALDRVALDRALSNLLSHAIAGARGGNVWLSVTAEGGTLVFTVEDGAEAGAARPGQDFGLAVAQAMVAALDGTLVLGSRPEGGLSARLMLPGPAWTPTDAAAEVPDLEGRAVALGLPGGAEAREVAAAVTRHGGRIVAAEASAPGVALLLDADAPGGLAAIAGARARGLGPIVALTASLLAARRAELADIGADAVLTRPLPPPKVIAATILDAGRLPDAAASDEAIDPAKLERLLDLAGPEVGAELLARLAEDLGTVDSAFAAAVPARDIPALRAQTHVLISLAGAVGADRLQHLAEDLNAAAHAGDAAAIDRLAAAARPLLAALRMHVEAVQMAREPAQ